ncbi:uncharacterized protein PGTG_04944 [Puccinia graminis f. sp. tritici CRL 75-36-700-3]|uniref:Uncharacterized protein n=1 Tax=Puccinia graminis f. sp. tritici (strain CRL 75-36-700-3 / race SCCL) TaxID=418459 RepID=E3K3D1_PUCGT|nr:uncharacterized protein PGTG_04944 [Puccinia graminis f. sp. tritici CRL 75-36-700-3]EFP78988.2 hypothetical protein PGTG_04944 [Puccinia graminis f. sp. tritici CRL 75-36-700-3]
MFTQRNALFIALAITFTNLLLSVQGLALPLSSQTQAVHSSYLKRNVNSTISAPVNPKHDLPGQSGVPLVQRDIPPPVLKAIETVGKFVKRDSLAERDIPPPVLKAIETVGKFIKRDSLAQRDIPAPVLKMIETVGKLV